MAGKSQDPIKRFWKYVEPVTESGCWIWMGALKENGYGAFRALQEYYAHRFSYVQFKGPISDRLEVDHLCRVRCCVNPDHLELVTHKENSMRSPISPSGINAKKTQCKRGHPFSLSNTWLEKGNPNRRHCRHCHADREYARRNQYFVCETTLPELDKLSAATSAKKPTR